MNVFNLMKVYPIGSEVHLMDDDPGTIREVCGYEWYSDHAYILFKDGTKLSSSRLELILEVS